MKAGKKSSIHKAASSKRKGTARHPDSPPGIPGLRGRPSKRPPASTRFLKLATRPKNPGSEKELRLRIPPVLLEGDAPGVPSPLPPARAAEPPVSDPGGTRSAGELPEAYGTQRFKLTPRDPHWIHAHWDFTRQQLRSANAQSAEGHLLIRLYERSTEGPLVSETSVRPESTRWLVYAPQPGARYAAEIGFYNPRREWSALAAAAAVRTPPAGPSADQGFEAATLTPEGVLQRHGTIQTLRPPSEPAGAEQLSGGRFPSSDQWAAPGSLQQPREVGEVSTLPPSSFEISSWRSAHAPSSVSHPVATAPAVPFHLEVNAELIVYGATDPNATLRVGDRIVPLAADGTFRLRFALPDGAHQLPVRAVSGQTGEQRDVRLRFERHTDACEGVAAAPQTPDLKSPGAENL